MPMTSLMLAAAVAKAQPKPAPRPLAAPVVQTVEPDQTWFGLALGFYNGERTDGGVGRMDFTHTTDRWLMRGEMSGYIDAGYNCFLFCGSINEQALLVGHEVGHDFWASIGINRTATHGFGDPVPGFVTAGVPLEIVFAPRTVHPVGLEVALHGDLNHKTSMAALTVGVRFGSMPQR